MPFKTLWLAYVSLTLWTAPNPSTLGCAWTSRFLLTMAAFGDVMSSPYIFTRFSEEQV
uniref:Uncharacterized protein n=1 Tax=Picea glauca TaxID=3330 RepID=A0A101M3I9_PICGL|nr:hypothetical protein ABT39_MTgene75 [Picea glauca]QHR90757.1 hypothetical protein Q903MT_gene4783 [Picea sitchensis]